MNIKKYIICLYSQQRKMVDFFLVFTSKLAKSRDIRRPSCLAIWIAALITSILYILYLTTNHYNINIYKEN